MIVPMGALRQVAGRGSWPPNGWPPREEEDEGFGLPRVPAPGERGMTIASEWEFLAPVRVGDHLSISDRLADVYIKPIRLDPEAFWIVTERIYRNQHQQVVAINRSI